MAYMLAGDMSLNISGSGGNTDRKMNRVLRDIVQDRTNDCLTDLIEMIVADNNYRPDDSADAKDISLFCPDHLPDLISLRLAPVKLTDSAQLASGIPDAFLQCPVTKSLEQYDFPVFHLQRQFIVYLNPGLLKNRFRKTDSLAVSPFPDLYFHDFTFFISRIYAVYPDYIQRFRVCQGVSEGTDTAFTDKLIIIRAFHCALTREFNTCLTSEFTLLKPLSRKQDWKASLFFYPLSP